MELHHHLQRHLLFDLYPFSWFSLALFFFLLKSWASKGRLPPFREVRRWQLLMSLHVRFKPQQTAVLFPEILICVPFVVSGNVHIVSPLVLLFCICFLMLVIRWRAIIANKSVFDRKFAQKRPAQVIVKYASRYQILKQSMHANPSLPSPIHSAKWQLLFSSVCCYSLFLLPNNCWSFFCLSCNQNETFFDFITTYRLQAPKLGFNQAEAR